MRGEIRYIAVSLLSTLLFGASFPFVVHAIEAYGAGSVLSSVYGVAAVMTLVFVATRYGIASATSISLSAEFFTRAVLFVGQVVPLYVALQIVDRAFLGGVFLCFFLWPALALFYVKWLTNVKVAREMSLFVAASFMVLALGFEFFEQAVLGLRSAGNVLAYLLALVAANSCSLYAAVTRRFGHKGKGNAMTPVLCLLVAICGLAMSAGNPEHTAFVFSWPLMLVGVATGIAHVLWDTSVRRGNALLASVLASFSPWVAIFCASVLVGVGLVEHLEECLLLLLLAWISIALVLVPLRSAKANEPRLR